MSNLIKHCQYLSFQKQKYLVIYFFKQKHYCSSFHLSSLERYTLKGKQQIMLPDQKKWVQHLWWIARCDTGSNKWKLQFIQMWQWRLISKWLLLCRNINLVWSNFNRKQKCGILCDGNTRLPYLTPEKPECRSRSNS